MHRSTVLPRRNSSKLDSLSFSKSVLLNKASLRDESLKSIEIIKKTASIALENGHNYSNNIPLLRASQSKTSKLKQSKTY